MKYTDNRSYGSVQPMCWSIYLTGLTEERIKTLKIWSERIEKGDVCSGSEKLISPFRSKIYSPAISRHQRRFFKFEKN
jgi:hypothetical protein